MLTENEKKILGYMVDMGFLRGQMRINAGADDEAAKEILADFAVQMQAILPQQISSLEAQKQRLETELAQAQDLQSLLV